jgi:putative transposase
MIATGELGQQVGLRQACAALNVSRATFYRRRERSAAPQPRPPQAATSPRGLSGDEITAVRALLNSERYQDRAPREVYAAELDAGRYHCSVRTMYRILSKDHATRERRNQLRHPDYAKPELLAQGPNQLWTWDITKLLGPRKGEYFHLYVILDAFSRYVVGWMLAHCESAELAARLIRETVDKEGVLESQLTIHSDRGPAMKSQGVAQLLASLGVAKSHSRPHVSNDNPFSESQFKTLKYCPEFPDRFATFAQALEFCRKFFLWYNDEHYHSGIGLLTPAMLHRGTATAVREKRVRTLHAAYAAHPERFVQGLPMPAELPTAVWINPPSKVNAVDESCGEALPHSERALKTDLVCAQEKRLPETVGLRKPEAPLAHPWPDYPSLSCVPAELKSVSSSVEENTAAAAPPQHPLDTLAMPPKILGVWGQAPSAARTTTVTETMRH